MQRGTRSQQPTSKSPKPETPGLREWNRPSHLSRIWSLSRTTVSGFLNRGELPYTLFGSSRRVSREAAEAFIAARTVDIANRRTS